ncbi:hypothetical protein P171DRAFT_357672 [Karstenula rhodostoma CBS 690.94]|uniref:RRM domain-containing protein n=1 Tax=Karstenula rhodostoma CBS 690.94 TaxID=1392251 RepID=A0A9P4PLL8_9PLEO|nr:hypothetical protein P171DRAFT_357672 [Karstenula rhodostoma CBS 690.94]
MSPNHSPPPSSSTRGPPSSPFAGTDPTLYTPEAVRKGGRTAVPESSKAAGKKPVVELPAIRHTAYHGLNPQPHDLPVFVNEIDAASREFISRYVLVQLIPDGNRDIEAGSDHETELTKVQDKMKEYAVFDMCVPIYSRGVYLRFDNLQDAGAGKLILEQHLFRCCYVDNYTFAIAKSQDTAAIDEFEGQIRVEVHAVPVVSGLPIMFTLNDLKGMHDDLEAALSRFGSIRDFVHTSTDQATMMFVFRFEFYSVEVANRARASLLDHTLTRMDQHGLWSWNLIRAENWTGPRPPNSPHRRLPRIDDKGRFMEFRHAPIANAPSLPVHDEREGCHNKVYRSKIVEGSDVRTTIMLRNIPNKLDWMSLKTLLDRVCFGTYDFIYLRIDFKSGHNVGYAFINFTDMSGMISMLDKVEHRGWPGYRSSKNAELSYATIQGREALVQKFRNSSVMQQTPYCRPRLFITKEEAWINQNIRKTGVEVKFPDPDNWSKFQRSIDSARTVGLFPPTGVVHQSIDRAHLSSYDRGTPRDMVHMYNQYGHPPTFKGFSEQSKRTVEQLFHAQFGPAQSGMVSFENIPLRLAQQLLGETGSPTFLGRSTDPGVIARPAATQAYVATPPIPMYAYAAGPAYTSNDLYNGVGYYQGGDELGDFE